MHSNIERPEKPQKTAKVCHSRAFSLLKKKKYNIVKVCVKDTFINVQKDYNKVQTTGYTLQQEGPNPTCRQNKDYSDEEKHRPNRITSSVKHGGGNVVLCYGHLFLFIDVVIISASVSQFTD